VNGDGGLHTTAQERTSQQAPRRSQQPVRRVGAGARDSPGRSAATEAEEDAGAGGACARECVGGCVCGHYGTCNTHGAPSSNAGDASTFGGRMPRLTSDRTPRLRQHSNDSGGVEAASRVSLRH
jgi:hypothetical protein